MAHIGNKFSALNNFANSRHPKSKVFVSEMTMGQECLSIKAPSMLLLKHETSVHSQNGILLTVERSPRQQTGVLKMNNSTRPQK
jgi:hypothetical protein